MPRLTNDQLADDVKRGLAYAKDAYPEDNAHDHIHATLEQAKMSLAILVDRAEGSDASHGHHKTIEEVEAEVLEIGERKIRM